MGFFLQPRICVSVYFLVIIIFYEGDRVVCVSRQISFFNLIVVEVTGLFLTGCYII